MKDKQHQRMINLGSWLEDFLKPNLKVYEYRILAERAISIYEINFCLTNEELTLKSIEHLISQKENFDVFLNKYWSDDYFMNSFDESLLKGEDIFQLGVFVAKQIGYQEGFQFPGEIVADICRCFITMFGFKANLIPYYFNEIRKRDEIWSTIFKSKWDPLALNYSGISDQLEFDDEKGMLVKQKAFSKFMKVGGLPPILDWAAIVSRIFFDFLLLGGQDYFTFCEYCGRFTAIQRRGRKRFCSDICRTANQHK
jgi:hypothetical protein